MVLEKEKMKKAHQLRNLLYFCCFTFTFSLLQFHPDALTFTSLLCKPNSISIFLIWWFFFFYGQSDWNFWSLLPSSSMATQTASSSSYFPKYDVFLSFCGVDTRHNFTDHLYVGLKQRGIFTFRDDKNLERGKYISQELLKAIEESRFAIVILSENYVYSRWCMIELVKIVERKKEEKLTIVPVFYGVDPSDVRNCRFNFVVRNQMGTIVNIDDVQARKAALNEVGNIAGWDIRDR